MIKLLYTIRVPRLFFLHFISLIVLWGTLAFIASSPILAQCHINPSICGPGFVCDTATSQCVVLCGGNACAPGERCDTTINMCIRDDCRPGRGNIDLGGCLRLRDNTPISAKYSNFSFLVNLLVRNLFVVAGVLLFLMIIIAGVKMVSGGKKGLEEGRNILGVAFAGFILMFSAYWIVQLIKYVTGADIQL